MLRGASLGQHGRLTCSRGARRIKAVMFQRRLHAAAAKLRPLRDPAFFLRFRARLSVDYRIID